MAYPYVQTNLIMRLVVQRVSKASVSVDEEVIGKINGGLLVFVGIAPNDTQKDIDWLINKILKLRLFEDEEGRLKQSITDIQGELLVVSQFTLYADVRKGTAPSWSNAASPDKAAELYADFIENLKKTTELVVKSGKFQAHMIVDLVNDGPMTMIIDSPTLA